jgi:hypothetical protein
VPGKGRLWDVLFMTMFARRSNDTLTKETLTGEKSCYSNLNDPHHKWRLVLETVHFALVQRKSPEATLGD